MPDGNVLWRGKEEKNRRKAAANAETSIAAVNAATRIFVLVFMLMSCVYVMEQTDMF